MVVLCDSASADAVSRRCRNFFSEIPRPPKAPEGLMGRFHLAPFQDGRNALKLPYGRILGALKPS